MNPRIIMKSRQVASLPLLYGLALKKIFDKKHLTYKEEVLLEYSVKHWPKKIDLGLEEKRQLRIILDYLIKDERGNFNKAKETFMRHQIDYRKVYSERL